MAVIGGTFLSQVLVSVKALLAYTARPLRVFPSRALNRIPPDHMVCREMAFIR